MGIAVFQPELFKQKRVEIFERFNARVEDADCGCWLWTATTKRGYGYLYVAGGNIPAHRVSWMLHRGDIPAGLIVCHQCDTPGCVNPDHLFLGTHADNAADRSKKLRTYRPLGGRESYRKLTEADVRLIRSDARSCAEMGRALGVHPNTISKVRLGRAWKHVSSVERGDTPVAARRNTRRHSYPHGGFIVLKRSCAGGLVGNLRPTEHRSVADAAAFAAMRSQQTGEVFAVFREVTVDTAGLDDQLPPDLRKCAA